MKRYSYIVNKPTLALSNLKIYLKMKVKLSGNQLRNKEVKNSARNDTSY